MVAELLIPTRSSGFIKVGQSVKLRFEAFPYQRFGGVEGYISTIDKSLIINGEIPLPLELNEPVYRVRVKLLDQMVSAYGEEFPLRSGMLLEANIVLDKRSLFEWITDPIASIKGNL
jgi:membrane fusion protein